MTQKKERLAELIASGKGVLGMEFGSTRIKAVLNDEQNNPVASGSYDWENRLENGIWTYDLEEILKGMRECYADLAGNVKNRCGAELTKVAAIGFSGMMHGYMAFDKEGCLMVPFRTWRNNITGEAAERLSALFSYNIPQRWTIAHLYQAMLNGEGHVKDLDYVTTLSGYIHWRLTGNRVLGIGEASGVFPIDTETKDYRQDMVELFDRLAGEMGYRWKMREIFPRVMTAGESAGFLTAEGARLLDPSGKLEAGIPMCPPEGDAGTGMTATNSVARRTGNVSAGTSVFAMLVLERELSQVYPQIDMVTTPAGDLVAMVHSQNCTSDLNAWVGLFQEFAAAMGMEADKDRLYQVLYNKALEGDYDCGGLLSYCYFSGEHITEFTQGRPLFVRKPESHFTLANFMRSHLFTCLGALKIGLDILMKNEQVKVDRILGHGGLFKTKEVGQRILAAAVNAPVSVMDTAGEGGAWGIALLASYMIRKEEGQSLEAYLEKDVFGADSGTQVLPDPEDVRGFETFIRRYQEGLAIEQAAVDHLC